MEASKEKEGAVAKSQNQRSYLVEINWDDPYPKKLSKTIAARTHGRAIDFATRELKKQRGKGKREPIEIRIKSIKL